MKTKHILLALGISAAAFSLQSCLDFDTTGAEFDLTTSNVEKVTRRGDVDKLDFNSTGIAYEYMTPQLAEALGLTGEQVKNIVWTPEQIACFLPVGEAPATPEGTVLKITLEQAKIEGLTPKDVAKLQLTAEQLKAIPLTAEQAEKVDIQAANDVRSVAKKLSDNLSTAMGGAYWIRGGKNAQMPVSHAYQYQFTTGVDILAQYGVVPHTFYAYAKVNVTSAYDINPQFYGGAMGGFKGLATSIVPLLNTEQIDSIPEVKALFSLLYDYAAIEVADIYGPMPYSDIKTNKQENPYVYESVQDIYKKVATNVDSIIRCFEFFDGQHLNADGKQVDNKTARYKQEIFRLFGRYETMTENALMGYQNLEVWKRFANSLKLRMAMHIVKVEPQLAQQWAEAAVKSGVVETYEQEVAFRPSAGFSQPLMQIYDWGDARMTASMESLLKSLDHPYINNLFIANKNEFVNNKTKEKTPAESGVFGMRSGAQPGMNQGYDGNQYIAFSTLNKETFNFAPLYLMKTSEVSFLRAEGALRGWNMGGTAEEFYNKGIRQANFEDRMMASMTYPDEQGNPYARNFYAALIDKYMAKEAPTPFTYHDPTGDTPDEESVTKIGVKWNESDSKEVKLEKIITQKYIAGFPYSFEAYVDLRRTGYPKLFPVLNTDECAYGIIYPGDMVRRLPFPGNQDAATMQDLQATGLKALGGADECSTRLWWDIDQPNF